MDWLQFISSVISALAWPLVVVALLFLLRERLGELADRIEEITFPGGKAKFVRALEKGRERAESIIDVFGVKLELGTPDVRTHELSDVPPEKVITDAFREVEETLIRLREVLALPPRLNLHSIVRQLHARGLVTADTVELFDSLREARNAATHVSKQNSITPSEAMDFRIQANVLLGTFRRLLDQHQKKPSP